MEPRQVSSEGGFCTCTCGCALPFCGRAVLHRGAARCVRVPAGGRWVVPPFRSGERPVRVLFDRPFAVLVGTSLGLLDGMVIQCLTF